MVKEEKMEGNKKGRNKKHMLVMWNKFDSSVSPPVI
jgi:hypothetical protein